MNRIFKEIIPEDKVIAFRNYKYAGADNSILYQYVISPFCDWLVENVIPPYLAFYNQTKYCIFIRSLSSDFFVQLFHILYLCFYMDSHLITKNHQVGLLIFFRSEWWHIWSFKQILDNADGKHARKTGNASTLGSLFDHSCDVVNLTLTFTTVAGLVGMHGTEYYLFAAFFCISFSIPVVEQ